MTTDRDLINQLMYAIKTNNFDDIAEVMAAYVSKGYNRGYDDGQRQKADEVAKRLLTIGMQAEKVANIVGLDIIEVLKVGFQDLNQC